MASIAMLVSELAHSLNQPNNKALRENLKALIIHTRNEVIRANYQQNNYVDKGLTQRFKVSLIDVNDGELEVPEGVDPKLVNLDTIKRSAQKVPRPVRLTNNLPFDRVSSLGYRTSREFPYLKETSARFRRSVPGLCGVPCYDYINGYIYIFPSDTNAFMLNTIVIESVFEHPNEIELRNNEVDPMDVTLDENEWLLSEDMIGQIKDIIYRRDLLANVRQTNEAPNAARYNG